MLACTHLPIIQPGLAAFRFPPLEYPPHPHPQRPVLHLSAALRLPAHSPPPSGEVVFAEICSLRVDPCGSFRYLCALILSALAVTKGAKASRTVTLQDCREIPNLYLKRSPPRHCATEGMWCCLVRRCTELCDNRR